MAFTEQETKRIEAAASAFLEQARPPEHLRHKVDISYHIHNQSVEIFEARVHFQDPSRIIKIPVAKTTYVRTQDRWHIFWHRSNMKWYRYDSGEGIKSIEDFFAVVRADELGCFWG